MFVLFLSTLVVAAGVIALVEEQEEELKKEAARIGENQKKLDELKEKWKEAGFDVDQTQVCGLATPVVQTIRSCLDAGTDKMGKTSLTQTGLSGTCGITITGITFKEKETKFDDSSAGNAELAAQCIIQGAEKLLELEAKAEEIAKKPGGAPYTGVGLDAISIEGHADRCHYQRWESLGKGATKLPFERAKRVYDLVVDKVVADKVVVDNVVDGKATAEKRLAILARISTSSFGPYRSVTPDCDCANQSTCLTDRRVDIVVRGRIGKERPNWAPLKDIPLTPSRAAKAGRDEPEPMPSIENAPDRPQAEPTRDDPFEPPN
jgi:hypothetical protein